MTVHGLDHFTLAMNGVEDAFVVIGGIAAALLLEAAGLDSRVTKDVDVVLIAKDIAPFAAKLKVTSRVEDTRLPSDRTAATFTIAFASPRTVRIQK